MALRRRRNLALLVLAVIASQALLWWLRPAPEPRGEDGPPRSAYTLHDFSLDVLDADGRLAFHINAPRLEKRDADDSLFIEAPRLRLPVAAAPDWRGRAALGWVGPQASELQLRGDVVMQQGDGLRLETEQLTAWPDARQLRSTSAVVLREPGRILSGTGLQADLDASRVELLADVHGTLEPAHAR